MTSLRQIEANCRNALHSTGPTSQEGKQRSRCNAIRHGLTAETVVTVLEDRADYEAFELSVTSGFDAQTAVERELVLRLASLLWRLRRATAIESGLLQIQSEILRDVRWAQDAQRRGNGHDQLSGQAPARTTDLPGSSPPRGVCRPRDHHNGYAHPKPEEDHNSTPHDDPKAAQYPDRPGINVEVARCFLRLANLDHGAFDRLSRYETALWRQVGQLLFTLNSLQRAR